MLTFFGGGGREWGKNEAKMLKSNLEASRENRQRGTTCMGKVLTKFVTTTATTRLANTNAPMAMKTRRKRPPPT